MVKNCVFCGKKQGAGSISFHKFPLNHEVLLEQWLQNMNLGPNFLPTPTMRLCSDHFSSDVLKRVKSEEVLLPGSVPTIFDRYKSACIYCGAKKCDDKMRSFHVFPLEKPLLLAKWTTAMNLPDFTPNKQSFLCSDHFEESCYKTREDNYRRLKPNAVPSLFNPCFQEGSQEMVKCFAPGCTSGQANSKEKVYLFKPSSKEIVEKWSKLVPRFDRPFGENDYLCTKHFDEKDIIIEEVLDHTLYPRTLPRLVKNASPMYFSKIVKVNTSRKQSEEINNSFNIKTEKTCIACKCSETIENGEKNFYYLFPINPQLRKEWIGACAAQIKNKNISEFSYLCSKHFEKHCFESVKLGTLKDGAIPTRFGIAMQSTNTSSIEFVESLRETEIKAENRTTEGTVPFCIVKSCTHKGNLRGITYHKIPNMNYEKWANALKNYAKTNPIPQDSRVCSMHFRAKDFLIKGNQIKLNSDAVPIFHINEYLTNESTSSNDENASYFKDNEVKKLKQSTLLTNVITPATDIVKSDFSVIDINSIINKALDNEFKDTNKTNTTNKTVSNKPIKAQNLTIINTMHNYCTMKSTERVQSETMESEKTSYNENDEEDKKKKSLIRKLNEYKNAYKRHKSLSVKQAENIVMLENKLKESSKKNKKLEQRILILEDVIHNMLKSREENIENL